RRRGEVGGLAAKEAQFGIGVEPAATYPPPEEKIAPVDVVGIGGWVGGQQGANLALQFWTQLLIGIELKYPGPGALADSRVLRPREPFPRLVKYLRVVRARYLHRAVRRRGVEHDDLVGKLNAGQRAREVRLLVLGDDGDRERLLRRRLSHRLQIRWLLRIKLDGLEKLARPKPSQAFSPTSAALKH